MRTRTVIAFLAICLGTACAQQSSPDQPVIQMTKAGVDESLIIQMVNTQTQHFTFSADDLIALKNAGVSNNVMAAMIQKSVQPLTQPSTATTSVSISDVRSIFISGNNEATADARRNLLKIQSKSPDHACFHISGVRAAADAVLDLNESDTSGGSGGIFGGNGHETTVVSGSLTNKNGDLLWSDAKQGIQGIVHTGAGDAEGNSMRSLFKAAGCRADGLRQ